MKNQIFREKSMERVSSPEQLHDYIRVANPGIWCALLGAILILVGVCVWGIFGRLDTTLSVGALTRDGQTVCYVREADISRVSADMTVRTDEAEYAIREISLQPVEVDESFPDYLCHVGGFSAGEWVYAVTLEGAGGESGSIFSAQIVIESVAPLSFVTN